jgi:hypothetical protein
MNDENKHDPMAEPADDLPPSAPEGFEVRGRPSANWLVRKIVEARAYAEQVKEWAALEIRRAEREERFFLERFGHQLEAWTRPQISSGRRKSLKLPAGTIGFRTESVHLEVKDETRLIAWCQHHLPDAIRVQTQVLKSLVNDHLEKTGECADIAGGGERFYVR